MGKWYFWRDVDRSPALNMAIDESLLHEVSVNLRSPLLRIYGWDRPAVSIGYTQKHSAAPKTGYTIVRRPTGGGVVFHDIDLTYTVIIPKGSRIEQLNRLESYRVLHQVITEALDTLDIDSTLRELVAEKVDRSTMACFVTPTRHDIVTREGNKIAGAAQRRTKYGILHQGSIVIEDISSRRNSLIKSIKSAFRQSFDIDFINFVPSEDFIVSVEKLAEEKYSTEQWNKHRTTTAHLTNQK